MPVTQTIVLAAGSGSRLDSAASGVPKPLMIVGGAPLVAHALAHARASGCVEALVVIGYEAVRVRRAVEALPHGLQIRFVDNPAYSEPNGVSLLAAERYAAPQFFLQMVDHVFAEPALPRLTAAPFTGHERGRVLVDRAPGPIDLEDATKVRLAGGRVSAIGKRLDRWDAIDAGCFLLSSDIFDAIRSIPAGEPRTVSAAMRRLVVRGALGAADVNGIPWVDVDTPDDRTAAEELLTRVQIDA